MRHVGGESERRSHGVALESRLGQAYNEQAFWYFLAIERKRSEQSGRPFLLVRVDLKEHPGVSVRINATVASKLFSGMSLCLRETDFIGWYRDEHVAGAVLADVRDGPGMEISRSIGQRINGALCERLPLDTERRLQVRVVAHPAPAGIEDGGPQVAELISGGLECSS